MIDCLFPRPKRPWYARLWRRLFPVRVKPFTSITLPMVRSGYPKLTAADIVGEEKS